MGYQPIDYQPMKHYPIDIPIGYQPMKHYPIDI